MSWRLSSGLLIASLLQAAIVAFGSWLRLSTFHPDVLSPRIFVHILIGQALGYILWAMLHGRPRLHGGHAGLFGAVYGVIAWALLLPLASSIGAVPGGWEYGSGLVTTLLAFAVYGFVAGLTVGWTARELAR